VTIEILELEVGCIHAMQDDQNGKKAMVLPSADKTRLTRFITSSFVLVANNLV
jgi:hypothetical protein